MPPNNNEPNTVTPNPPPQDLPGAPATPSAPINNSEPTTPPPTANTPIPSIPPTIPPKPHKVLVAVFLLVILIAVAVGAYYATRTTKTKPTTTTSSTIVVVKPAAITPGVVEITKTGFVPATIKVEVGQAVVWTNDDTAPHLIASDPYPTDNAVPTFNSRQALAPHDSYSYVFNQVGTFTYHDDLNPYKLKGTVIVSKS